MTQWAAIPNWCNSHHEPFYQKCCNDFNVKPVKISGRALFVRKNSVLYVVLTWKILKSYYFDGGEWYCKRLNHVFFIKHGIRQKSISRGLDGRSSFINILISCFLFAVIYYEIVQTNRYKTLKYIFAGDEAYIEFSFLCQLGELIGIKVTLFKGFTSIRTHEFSEGTLRQKYPWESNFQQPTASQVETARVQLQQRISGDRSSLPYMEKKGTTTSDFNFSKPGVWLFLHDFLDSPGLHGVGPYTNNNEWVSDTLKFCSAQKINVYLKTHPNGRKVNQKIVANFTKTFPNVTVVSDNVSLANLRDQGLVELVITVFGSVIVEGLFCNFQVLSAGPSPYNSLGIIDYPKSKTEYKNQILSLIRNKKLKQKSAIDVATALAKMNLGNKSAEIFKYPFNDIDENLWIELFKTNYPANIRQRRKKMQDSEKLRTYCEMYLKQFNLRDLL